MMTIVFPMMGEKKMLEEEMVKVFFFVASCGKTGLACGRGEIVCVSFRWRVWVEREWNH